MTLGEIVTLLSTLGLIGVTIWYAFQTQRMARTAKNSADSARDAAIDAARSVAILAAGMKVGFDIGPVYSFTGDGPSEFVGIRVVCLGSTIYLHDVVIDEVWAPDPDLADIEPTLTEVEIFPPGQIPRLLGVGDPPKLLHDGEAMFFDFPIDRRLDASVAVLCTTAFYSFDGKSPVRSRHLEWADSSAEDDGKS